MQRINVYLKELWLLLAEYAPITIIGIENPYQGWLVEDIEKDAEKNIQHLKDNGFLLYKPDGGYELLPDLRQAVNLIAKPQTVIIALDSTSGDSKEQIYYYLDGQESARMISEQGNLMIDLLPNRPVLLDQLLNALPLPPHPVPSTAFSLPEEILFQTSSLSIQANYAEARNLLDETNLSDAAAKELMEAFQDRQANASFAILTHPNDEKKQKVSGFGVLAGGNRLWMLTTTERLGKTSIEFSPTTPTQLRSNLLSLIS